MTFHDSEEEVFLKKLEKALTPPVRVWTPGELYNAALPPVEGFLAGKIFTRGSIVEIAGRRGVGKTYLILALMDAFSRGEPFAHLETKKCRTLFLSQEMVDSEIQGRLLEMYTPDSVERLSESRIICRDQVRIDSPGGVAELGRTISRAGGADVVFIDSYSDIRGSIAENDNDQGGEALRRVRDSVAGALGCCVVLTHHMGRPKEGESAHGRGFSAFEDVAADVLNLGFHRDGATRTGHFDKVRHMSPPADFRYRIFTDPDTSRVSVDAYEEKEGAGSESSEVKRLVDWFASEGEASVTKVQDAMSLSKSATLHYLAMACELGLLVKHKVYGEQVWATPIREIKEGGDVPF